VRLRTHAAAVVVLAGLIMCGTAGIAQAQESPIRVPGDATDCHQASLGAGVDIAGDVLLAIDGPRSGVNQVMGGVVTAGGTTLKAFPENPEYEITAVVVQGGGAYNVYRDEPFTGLRAPATGTGQFPTIGHWFICGNRIDTTPSPQPVPTKVPAGVTGDGAQHDDVVPAGLVLLGLLATGSAVVAWRRRPHGA
jgi:hypothetical protein